jgi:hypothetical protein
MMDWVDGLDLIDGIERFELSLKDVKVLLFNGYDASDESRVKRQAIGLIKPSSCC